MIPDDHEVRRLLVYVGLALGAKRYVGQHPTAAAHEFADAALGVVKAMENRVVAQLQKERS